MNKKTIQYLVELAFADVPYPGDDLLSVCGGGSEPIYVKEEFAGKDDWRILTPSFLNLAPRELGTALAFFSDLALQFYLPAYLIADLNHGLCFAKPSIRLCHGLGDEAKYVRIQQFGARSSFDEDRYRFSIFTKHQVEAIIAYLVFVRTSTDEPGDAIIIGQALRNFWELRVAEVTF